MRTASITAALAATLLLAASPVAAQDASAPADASAAPIATDGDIVDSIPTTIGGVATDIEIVRGQEHLEGLDPNDALDAQQIASLEEFVATLGAGIDDMTSISAVAVDDEALSFISGIQVDGADPEEMLSYYLESLIADMGQPYQEIGEIGGKIATLVIDESFDETLPLFVYGSGPRVWLVVAEEAVVEEALAQLP